MDMADKTAEEYSLEIAKGAFGEKVKPYLKEHEYGETRFRAYKFAEDRCFVTAYAEANDSVYIFHFCINPENGHIVEFNTGAKMPGKKFGNGFEGLPR